MTTWTKLSLVAQNASNGFDFAAQAEAGRARARGLWVPVPDAPGLQLRLRPIETEEIVAHLATLEDRERIRFGLKNHQPLPITSQVSLRIPQLSMTIMGARGTVYVPGDLARRAQKTGMSVGFTADAKAPINWWSMSEDERTGYIADLGSAKAMTLMDTSPRPPLGPAPDRIVFDGTEVAKRVRSIFGEMMRGSKPLITMILDAHDKLARLDSEAVKVLTTAESRGDVVAWFNERPIALSPSDFTPQPVSVKGMAATAARLERRITIGVDIAEEDPLLEKMMNRFIGLIDD